MCLFVQRCADYLGIVYGWGYLFIRSWITSARSLACLVGRLLSSPYVHIHTQQGLSFSTVLGVRMRPTTTSRSASRRPQSDPRLEGLILEALGWAHDGRATLFVVKFCSRVAADTTVIDIIKIIIVVAAHASVEIEVVFGDFDLARGVAVRGEAGGCENVVDDAARGFFCCWGR